MSGAKWPENASAPIVWPRYELFEKIKPILVANNLHDLNDDDLVILLLYGHHNLKFHENQFILKSTIKYIGKSERFSQL